MRSVEPSDLTGRARIRDSAIRLFAKNGYSATSVRGIAEEAAVSATLVIHHFGSKERLREACDEHVLTAIFEPKGELHGADPGTVIQSWLRDVSSYRPLLDYLSRIFVDGTESSALLFSQLVSHTEAMIREGVDTGTVREHKDPRMLAVLVTAQGLMPLVLHRQLRLALVGEPDLEEVIRRMTLPLLELYSHGLYTDTDLLDSARAAAQTDSRAHGASS